MKFNRKKILLSSLSLAALSTCVATPIIVDKAMNKVNEQNLVLLNDNSSSKKENKNPNNIWIIYVVFGVILLSIILFIVIFQIIIYIKKKRHYVSHKDYDIENIK